ncbi:O-fucosyltransferase family protein [Abeliophyllum distichum]|uniref:O-fucosyltransferase family protein n=1 Tax=Abeliophyllum distichum TaxID=126358 RepID=A0ABD1R027_9LAMI
MAVDLRQVFAAFLTASMFIMLGNMIKRDHVDPLLETVPASLGIQHDALGAAKPRMTKLNQNSYGPKEQNSAGIPCWKKASFKGIEQRDGYIFFSLTNGPENHASQVANAVAIARQLGATLVLPDVRGTKVGEKRNFAEIYDVNKFITSLDGVVRVANNISPAQISSKKLTTARVPNRVSEDFITSAIEPIFRTKRNLRLSQVASRTAGTRLIPVVGTLRSKSQKTHGRFVAVDLSVDLFGKKGCLKNSTASKQCYNAKEIGEFLKKIGFETDTMIYLTQSGWHSSLDALRNTFPNTFTKDAIMPADVKGKFMDLDEYKKFIDFYICLQSDVFVPAYPSRFYASVVGMKIASGKTQILVPAERDSASANDYVSPYIAKKSHFAYTCFCKDRNQSLIV